VEHREWAGVPTWLTGPPPDRAFEGDGLPVAWVNLGLRHPSNRLSGLVETTYGKPGLVIASPDCGDRKASFAFLAPGDYGPAS